jgi:hypothetical protein
MFGTLAGALSGRNIPFDRPHLTATVDGRIVGVGRTIRIRSIAVHYELTAPVEHRDAIERALRLHPEGCPAHQSVNDAIDVTWDARLHLGDDIVEVREAASA